MAGDSAEEHERRPVERRFPGRRSGPRKERRRTQRSADAKPWSALRRRASRRRSIQFGNLILLSCLVGLGGGLLGAAYFYVMNGMLDGVWNHLAPAVGAIMPWGLSPIWVVTAIGGFIVGIALWKMGTPGEISAVVNNINMQRGRLDIRQTPSMVVVSLISIAFGGSAGPEAPLVSIIGSLGSRLGDRLRLHGQLVRTLTFCGMSAALGALFGSPLGGALFSLEIPHRRGLEYYEALVPSIIAAVLSFAVFRGLVPMGPLIQFSNVPMPDLTATVVIEGLGLGLLGGGVGVAFIYIFRGVNRVLHPMEHRTILLATLGGLSIGIIALLVPAGFPSTTLFWGEFQIPDLVGVGGTLLTRFGLPLAIGFLLLFALLKTLAVGMTLHSGFRGGFIFPLFLIGGATGLAVSLATGGAISAPVAMLCMMAAVNVAVTKTPISSAVILTTLSGTSMLPVIVAACLASFILTTRITLIDTQRSRAPAAPHLTAAAA